ncbi:MAG: hypothetical protein ACKPFK_04700, partial [Dolichospermum sp.]
YHHLALELLSPTKEPIKEIGVANGLFTTEPVLAEFIRMAIASGFSVISCQPDYSIANPHERKKNPSSVSLSQLTLACDSQLALFWGERGGCIVEHYFGKE